MISHLVLYLHFINLFAAVQNTASEALSHPYQDPALNDAALQEMLEKIDSSKLGKYKHYL